MCGKIDTVFAQHGFLCNMTSLFQAALTLFDGNVKSIPMIHSWYSNICLPAPTLTFRFESFVAISRTVLFVLFLLTIQTELGCDNITCTIATD